MKNNIRTFFLFFITSVFFTISLSAQEALKSIEEEYYDFLSLNGIVERPTLGYRTLSDSVWVFNEVESFEENEDGTFTKVRVDGRDSSSNIWKNNNLGTTYNLWTPSSHSDNWFTRGLNQGLTARIYGPEWFNSYNTAAPYGQNDGALWQGRGYNTALTAGVRLEGYGFELTFKPQVSWSQNREFDFIQPAYSGENFKNKADTFGYYGVTNIDAPQRFGDSPFWNFDWGDTEVRWSWRTFTVGFGTQSIWLGPAKLNPIIHSNNAPAYPKFDIGLRKTKLTMPHFGWDLGDIEARAWWGKLSESDWFDNDDGNDNNLISGLSISYEFPGIFKGFSIGCNRTMLSKWDDISSYSLFKIYNPLISSGNSGGKDANDQRISFIFDYYLNKAGFEIYLEWARNDYSPTKDYYVRYPFHTQGWTFGSRKEFNLPFGLKGQILLELTNLECSADYDRLLSWYSTFYAHHIISQGYTNKGQWLGAGIGTGGNSQYLGLSVFHKTGSITLFAQRRNPDLDYTYFIDSKNTITNTETNIRATLNFGLECTQYFINNIMINGNIIFIQEHNPLNISQNNGESADSEKRYNLHFQLLIGYRF